MIEEAHCGFAVPPDDPVAFADALERAAAGRDALRVMGENARQLALREFDRRILAERFVGWLEGAA